MAMYEDEGLSKYFNAAKAEYFRRRYDLWLVLVPGLMVLALVISVAVEHVT